MDQNNPRTTSFFNLIRTNALAVTGGVIVALFILTGLLAPWISPYNPYATDLSIALTPPDWTHWFGTDYVGRDLLSRIIYGAQISLLISGVSIIAGTLIGVPLGIIAGWDRRAEWIIMRLADVFLCFPGIIVALTIISILGPGLQNLILAIVIQQIPEFVRLAQGLTLTVREELYVEAGVSIGASTFRLLFRYILPNIVAPIIIQMTIMIPGAIMTSAGLNYLGLGIEPPQAEWGGLIQESFKWFRKAPHTMIYPGLTLMLVVFGFNLFGDGLRVILDPRMKGR